MQSRHISPFKVLVEDENWRPCVVRWCFGYHHEVADFLCFELEEAKNLHLVHISNWNLLSLLWLSRLQGLLLPRWFLFSHIIRHVVEKNRARFCSSSHSADKFGSSLSRLSLFFIFFFLNFQESEIAVDVQSLPWVVSHEKLRFEVSCAYPQTHIILVLLSLSHDKDVVTVPIQLASLYFQDLSSRKPKLFASHDSWSWFVQSQYLEKVFCHDKSLCIYLFSA